MRQDYFEFTPQFKLLIAGNHKPGLRSVDEAIRRRINLIPFAVTIPPEERDDTLLDRLRAEWGGILGWALDGCTSWLKGGLAPPSAVQRATSDYLDAEDASAAWISECCNPDPDAWTASSVLYASWAAWATRTGEHAGSMKRFVQNLEAKGYATQRRPSARGFLGLEIASILPID
jgi:putative DNA primase/helicase